MAGVKERFQKEKVEEESGRESSGPEGAAIVKAGPLVTAERGSVFLPGVAEGQKKLGVSLNIEGRVQESPHIIVEGESELPGGGEAASPPQLEGARARGEEVEPARDEEKVIRSQPPVKGLHSLGVPEAQARLAAAVVKKTQEAKIGFQLVHTGKAGPNTAEEARKQQEVEGAEIEREALSKVNSSDRAKLAIMLDERKLFSEVSKARLRKELKGRRGARWEERFIWWLHKLGSLKAFFQYITWSQSRWLLVRGAQKQREQAKEEAAKAWVAKKEEMRWARKSSGELGADAEVERSQTPFPDPRVRNDAAAEGQGVKGAWPREESPLLAKYLTSDPIHNIIQGKDSQEGGEAAWGSDFSGAEEEEEEGEAGRQVGEEVTVVEVRNAVGQWIVFEGCGRSEVPEIARQAAKDLRLGEDCEPGGHVWLEARAQGGRQAGRVSFRVVEEAAPSIRWAGPGHFRKLPQRLPRGPLFQDYDGEVIPAEEPREEDVEAWWLKQAEEATSKALEEGEEQGGLFESDACTPSMAVLGEWMKADAQGVGREYEYTRPPDGNPAWMREMASVFSCGKICDEGMLERWRDYGADEEILKWIKEGGYKIKVGEGGKGINERNSKDAREHPEALQALILEVLVKGSWELVNEEDLINIIPIGLAPKPSKIPPFRLINDARLVNEHVGGWKFRYESLNAVPLVVNKGDWMFTLDLEDAYYSFLLQEESRNLFGGKLQMDDEAKAKLAAEGFDTTKLQGDTAFVRPKGLPMGFKNSCAIWTKIFRTLTRKWREQGIALIHYMDDLLFSAPTQEECDRIRKVVLHDIIELGMAPSWGKTMGCASKRVKFLGIIVDSEEMRFFVPGERLDKLEAAAEAVRQGGDKAALRDLASVAGKVMSMTLAIPAARLLTKECYNLIRPSEVGWEGEAEVTQELRDELLDIATKARVWNRKGAPIRRSLGALQLRITSDASPDGYGYRLDGNCRQWQMGEAGKGVARDWQDDDELQWQAWRELKGLEMALLEQQEAVAGRSVLMLSDAKAAVAYIENGAGSSKVMSTIMRRIFDFCMRNDTRLRAEWVKGTDMKDAGVDSLSRWGEFQVRKGIFDQLSSSTKWGRYGGASGYTVDLYAAENNRHCARYAARGALSEAEGGSEGAVGDARCFKPSDDDNLWICPPTRVIQQAVEGFMEMKARGTVVVPDWEGQPWYLYLRERALHSTPIPWSKTQPAMVDAASKDGSKHGADAWGFRAFCIDNRDGMAEVRVSERQESLDSEGARRALNLSDRELEILGVMMRRVRQRRDVKVLDICSGIASGPWAMRELGIRTCCWGIELDEAARKVAAVRVPEEQQLIPHDVWFWASEEGLLRIAAMKPDLVVAGFPCQSVSVAAPHGQGLKGKSGVFEAVSSIVKAVRAVNPEADFLLECTDFSKRHPSDWKYVSDTLGVEPVVICASRISACCRKRAYWTSFDLVEPARVEVDPNSVLDPGRTSLWEKLPTIVASGQSSWNTKEVVEDEWGEKRPLNIAEMERAMMFEEGFTEAEGLRMQDRFRLVGNAFHVGVLKHLMLCYVAHLVRRRSVERDDVRQRGSIFLENQDGPRAEVDFWDRMIWGQSGKPETDFWESALWGPEGKPSEAGAQRGSTKAALQHNPNPNPSQGGGGTRTLRRPAGVRVKCEVERPTGFEPRARCKEEKPEEKKKRKAKQQGGATSKEKTAVAEATAGAAWKRLVPAGRHEMAAPPASVWGLVKSRQQGGAQAPKLEALAWERQRPSERKPPPADPTSLALFGRTLADDYAMKSKAGSTWKSYQAWWEVMEAFGIAFGVDTSEEGDWQKAVELLRVVVALLASCYGQSTIAIFVSAVAFKFSMQNFKKPWESSTFRMTMEGIKRELGTAVKKQPPLEACHVAALLEIEGVPEGWTLQQWLQGKALVGMGWQLFNRRQDFGRLQPCDLKFTGRAMQVLIRYAKNDVRGKTRDPTVEKAEEADSCPVEAMQTYMAECAIGIKVGCDKKWGEPYACTKCPPLFPSIWTKGGVRKKAMPDARVSSIIKGLMRQVAETRPDLLSAEEAKKFSAKSMRCGGTSEAAAQCVRDGVTFAHGGWATRQSLIHYDLMKKGEETAVSRALNRAVRGFVATEASEPEPNLDPNPNVAPVEPRSGGASSSSEEEEEMEFVVERILEARGAEKKGNREFKVQWAPCKENSFGGERTWEAETTLRADGLGGKLDYFLRRRKEQEGRREVVPSRAMILDPRPVQLRVHSREYTAKRTPLTLTLTQPPLLTKVLRDWHPNRCLGGTTGSED